MELQMIFNLIIIALLVVMMILVRLDKKSDTTSSISLLFKKSAQAQRDDVQKQLSAATTEQFERFGRIQESVQQTLMMNREETNKQLSEFSQQMDARLAAIQKQSVENNDRVNATLEGQMKTLQESNEKRLEQMQGVVDEKLQKTLETRLTQSFETVGKHLESVQQGLGEMKSLAEDAKSLKNALTNVKDRGTYGEVRLERLLEDILAPSQYEKNANIVDGKVVEFAIKLPGNEGGGSLLLPIDAKFPIEDYNRLMAAEDKAEIESARKALLQSIRRFAVDISSKYIAPPRTTNFALMFLPTEGLYAEVIREAAFFEELRERYKIVVVGATTLSAFLGSLQIGFKTLAIEKHSQEVWETLGKVKGEFGKFQGALSTAHKQIKTAEGTLEKLSGTRMRAIERALRSVEEIGALEEEGDGAVLLDSVE
ncbi:MAG: DNA recombination protein RmuC [Turicibacter sp.]|nr:DNA recombination protein RmuC [Turicibacter sp.]